MGTWLLQNKGLYLVIKINNIPNGAFGFKCFVLESKSKEPNSYLRQRFLDLELGDSVTILVYTWLTKRLQALSDKGIQKLFHLQATDASTLFQVEETQGPEYTQLWSLLLIQPELESHFIKSLGHFFPALQTKYACQKENQRLNWKKRNKHRLRTEVNS